MPNVVAPLSLQAMGAQDGHDNFLISSSALIDAINAGEDCVLFGEGGIGKTTYLLDLSRAMLDAKSPRIPLYIDAAQWAYKDIGIFDYLATSLPATKYGVTFQVLLNLADLGSLTLAINGWNELPGPQESVCLNRFIELRATIPMLNVVVVSRAWREAPNPTAAKRVQRVQVRGLTWQGQRQIVRAELELAPANALIERLVQDTELRHAASNPLIMKGLLARAKMGKAESSSVFDFLEAAFVSFEEADPRRIAHAEPPLRRQHRHYLEALARHLTDKQETIASRQDVLPIISQAVRDLVDSGHLDGSRLDPSDILDALSNQHLLHAEGLTVRFAHHRFQEIFSAIPLYRACVAGDEGICALLADRVNKPFWESALLLVAGKLKGAQGDAGARVRLIRAALSVDLGFACGLAQTCAFSDADSSGLHAAIVKRVIALCDSPVSEVADYGVTCLIASGFPIFSDRIWSLIESDDQQTRLRAYASNGKGISLLQLDATASARISAWPPARQAELMYEVAINPKNYAFLVRAANDSVGEARAAAIAALTRNFPDVEVAVAAWLKAPATVALEHNALQVARDALHDGVLVDEVRNRLAGLAVETTTNECYVSFAWCFPDWAGTNALDAVLQRLRGAGHSDVTPLITFARKHGPDRLRVLARDLVLFSGEPPDWAPRFIEQESLEFRAMVFDAAWAILHSPGAASLRAEVVAPLANHAQLLGVVRTWLTHRGKSPANTSKSEASFDKQLSCLLDSVPGENLVSVVIELGRTVSYGEASEVLGLIVRRIDRDTGRPADGPHWLPTVDDVRALVAAFECQSDDAAVPQHGVHVDLCLIASSVAPAQFGDLLLDGCRLHLDAWSKYYAAHDRWLARPNGPRPWNPDSSTTLLSLPRRKISLYFLNQQM